MAKEFAWSFSKLKNFEDCPKRHYEIDLAKNYSEPITPGSPLDVGNRVHKAMANACGGVPLPDDFKKYQRWVDTVRGWKGGKLLVEQKYALTRSLLPTEYFSHDVWYRGIADVVYIAPPVGIVLDWKTGKFKPNSADEYGVQMLLMAQCIFSFFPEVKRVGSQLVWLEEGFETPENFSRDDVAAGWSHTLLDRAAKLEAAHKKQDYPPKPGRLCKKWCIVQSCSFWKKGAY